MNPLEQFLRKSSEVESRLGYVFKNKQLLLLAFTHCSFINEHRDLTDQHNERLEFLGDSVLGMLMAEHLYNNLPGMPEGELSALRARLVQATTCAAFVEQLQVHDYLLLGKGERMGDGRGHDSIAADLLEAIIGAIYLDGGLAAAHHFLFDHFHEQIAQVIATPARNWKAELQDYAQRTFQQAPVYEVIKETGPDHSKEFVVRVIINRQSMGEGDGSSKKEAQQAAAKMALLQVLQESDGKG